MVQHASLFILLILTLIADLAHSSESPFRNSLNTYARCQSKDDEIFSVVQKYQSAAILGDSYSRRESLSWLKHVLGKDSDSCFESMFHSYILASLLGGQDAGDLYANSLSSKNHSIVPMVAFLMNEGVIKPLTPALRNTWAQQGKKVWSKKSQNRYQVLGAYECTDGTLWIDSTLPPFDMIGVLFHELGHLWRDKFSKSDESAKDLRLAMLAEEFLSSLQAAIYQQTTVDFTTSDFNKVKGAPLYLLRSDVSLFKRGGEFEKLWKWSRSPGSILGFFDFYFGNSSIFADDHVRIGRGKIQESTQKIVDQVSIAYFGTPTSSDLMSYLNRELDPQNETFSEFIFKMGNGDFEDLFSDRLPELRTRLKSVSHSCKEFNRALSNGSLKDYKGKFGEGGVKPGEGGVKPCLRFPAL